jgi:excisionase family DNA binding protein
MNTSNETTTPPTLLTVAEAANELRCSIATVYREIAEKHLAYHKVRGKRLIHRDDLAEYIENCRRGGGPAPEVLTYTASKRKLSDAARELMGDDDFEVKPRPRKGAK